MVNVDNAIGILRYKVIAEYLHVAGEYNEGDILRLEYFKLAGLGPGLVLHFDVMKGDVKHGGYVCHLRMVADHAADIGVGISFLVAENEIVRGSDRRH